MVIKYRHFALVRGFLEKEVGLLLMEGNAGITVDVFFKCDVGAFGMCFMAFP